MPPSASSSSTPRCDDPDHHRVVPIPVTLRQPVCCTMTGGKLWSPAANTSRIDAAAAQCCPAGRAGSAQSAAIMACTCVVPVTVTGRVEASRVRLTTTRSALWPFAHSDPPAAPAAAEELPAPTAGAPDEFAPPDVDAGFPALPAATLPHAASPIRAVTAIRLCTPRATTAGLHSSPLDGPGPATVPPGRGRAYLPPPGAGLIFLRPGPGL